MGRYEGATFYSQDSPGRILYSLPKCTKSVYLRNNYLSLSRPEFVRRTIDELIQKGAVAELAKRPIVVNPLTVSSKAGKLRMVLDLRHINPHIFRQPCKIEGPETIAKYLPRATHMFGFDLKSGYHHVDIVPRHRPYLGFAYPDHRGKQRFFMFLVMPFGLAPAGFVFTKLLRVLVKIWQSRSIKIVVFFDDGMASAFSLQEGLQHSTIVKQDLILAGYIPNVDKCQWQPFTVYAWLGFLYDLVHGYIYAQQAKIEALKELLILNMRKRRVHVKTIAKITGTLSSLQLAYGNVMYIKSKYLQIVVAKSKGWNSFVDITKGAKGEMLFWSNYLQNGNGMRILNPVGAGSVVYSDASGVACAAVITPMPDRRTITVNRELAKPEQDNSSTYRELLAVFMGIHEARHLLRNQVLRWFTDSKCVVSIIRKGSMKTHLLTMALQIFYITKRYNISLSVTWLSRDHNVQADMASRIIDYDDWGVSPKYFAFITRRLGMPSVDRFADYLNTKLPRFNSRFLCPNTEAVDAFTQDWSNDFNWLVPPIYLVGRVLAYMKQNHFSGILIVPIWRSAYFWPEIRDIMTGKQRTARGYLVLGNIFKHYKNKKSLFGSQNWKSKTLAISLQF